MVNWAAGGALAAVAGVLIAPILFLNVAALAFTVLRGLAAALLGSFRSFWWTLAGAFGIGVIESTLTRYIEDKGVFGPVVGPDGLLFGKFTAVSVSRSAAFLVIVVVMVVGGRSLPLRSTLLDRLPAVGSGRISIPGLVLAVGAAAAVLLTAPDDWALALTITMATAIVCLSLVVVTGFVGQLSLAQMALAGFGAWAAGRLATTYDWPFVLAVLAGAAAAVPLGALVALPALRTRGINLAVLTFGLSVLVSEMVLGNAALTGGFDGTRPDPPEVFGVAGRRPAPSRPLRAGRARRPDRRRRRRGQPPPRPGGSAPPRRAGQRAGRRLPRRERPGGEALRLLAGGRHRRARRGAPRLPVGDGQLPPRSRASPPSRCWSSR